MEDSYARFLNNKYEASIGNNINLQIYLLQIFK